MKEKLEKIKAEALARIESADALEKLNDIRVAYLGKKGELTSVLKSMKDVAAEDRPRVGQMVNEAREQIEAKLEETKKDLAKRAREEQMKREVIDVTLPAKKANTGHSHPNTIALEEVERIFVGMGYEVVEGPEVEYDAYNFEKLNLPKDHPARDMQDTFYVTPSVLMRTQTSPMQARMLEKHDFSQGPLKMISPGKVYRRDTDDATHSHQFNQIEGMVVGKHITMADLKGTLKVVAQSLFGDKLDVRLRPSYFPFTEPSVEADITCFNCMGKGCSICKHTGWIEVLGAGMVHPNVLRMSGVDPEKFGGFAFGLGPDRFAMLKYGVTDIRNFYQNDVRFLTQFDRKG